MSILRVLAVVLVAFSTFVALDACSGGGGSGASGSNTQLRIVQGNPFLQALDYQIDSGSVITGAAPGVVQGYLAIPGGTHTVKFFTSGTNNGTAPTPAPIATCTTPSLQAGSKYSLVLVATSGLPSGITTTSTNSCPIFLEPANPANGTVIFHDAAGNSAVDQSGNSAASLFPVFCQPPSGVGVVCPNPTVPANAAAMTNAAAIAASGQPVNPVSVSVSGYPSATVSPGIAFTVSASSAGTPLCGGENNLAGKSIDPVFLPSTADSSDTSNFVPNGTVDTQLSIFVLDSPTISGSTVCPVTISGSIVP